MDNPGQAVPKRGGLLAGSICFILVLMAYYPVLTSTFGIYDAVRMAHDYGWVGHSRMTGVMLGGGRFLYALFVQMGFSLTPFLEDLWLLRTFSVLSLALSGFLIVRHACLSGWKPIVAISLGLVILLNPGVAVYGFWSACFPYGLTIIAAFFAGLLWERRPWSSRLFSILLLQAAFAIYQPAALFFILGPMVSWFGTIRPSTRPYQAIWLALGLGLGMLLHLVLARVVQSFPGVVDQLSRASGTGGLTAINNLIFVVFPKVAGSWGWLLQGHWKWGFMSVLGLGWLVFLFQSRGPGDRVFRFLVLLPIAMMFIPALISEKSYTPFRLLAPAISMVWLIGLVGISGLPDSRFLKSWMLPLAVGVLMFLGCSFVVRYGIVVPRAQEHAVLEEALQMMDTGSAPEGLQIIRPSGSYPTDKVIVQRDEYGAYELSYTGFSSSYVALIAAGVYGWKTGDVYPVNEVNWIFFPGDTPTVTALYPTLDMRVVLQGMSPPEPALDQGKGVDHPYLGKSLLFHPDLYLSSKYGLVQVSGPDWFFQPGRGWLKWESDPGESPLKGRDVDGVLHTLIPSGE